PQEVDGLDGSVVVTVVNPVAPEIPGRARPLVETGRVVAPPPVPGLVVGIGTAVARGGVVTGAVVAVARVTVAPGPGRRDAGCDEDRGQGHDGPGAARC